MKSKLRILHVIGGGEYGGAEQHILNLLNAFPDEEVDAAVVCFYDSVFAEKLREAGITVIPLHRFGRFDLRLLSAIQQAVASYKPDVLHTHGIKANFFTRLAAHRLAPVLVTTVHSNLRYDYTSPFAYLAVSSMERMTRRYNHHYIAISSAIRDLLQQDGVPPQRISLIYNGIDLTPFRQTMRRNENRERLLAEWGFPQDAFVFGTMARFVPVKGLHLLLEAFAQVVQTDRSRYRLVMIGDGSERPMLEALAVKLQLGDSVHFTGFRHDIPICLHAFDTFVHTSLYEGMGYTLIEAMASEVPVVATNVGGVKEIVFPSKTGILIPPNSVNDIAAAMTEMATKPHLRKQFVDAALKNVEETFTIQQMAKQTLNLYRELLEKNV